MKSAAVAAFGLFAGLASASSPIRHLHFPRANTTITTADDAAPTTLTVIATSVHTVISCAPTVTNCPARTNQTGIGSLPESARTTVVVTDTIVLATTVCPVAQASSISSSLQAAHSSGIITGSTLKPTPPAVTPPANPAGSSNGAVGVSVTNVVTDKTLTMTIGKGTDASVITTTVKATTQKTLTITSTLGNGENSPEPTTTTTATTTDTTYITVQPVQTAGGSSGSNTGGNAPPANGAPGAGTCEGAPTVTVTVAKETVTVPASTVFVTIAPSSCDSASSAVTGKPSNNGSGSGATGGNGNGSGNANNGSGSNSGSNSGSGNSGSGSGSEGSGSDNNGSASAPSPIISTPCPTDITTTVRATVTVQPYPINNGTFTSGAAQPSGFARLRR
ncbi:hypothetical protein TARUN_3391 [Trichoderma arundinaceum]|uniref:Uncharacterized protein n=1 Tax=Trichoderma arundinaceum TaxID=490622 RepID=A0A395NSA9_TRIAR|nr:hypothetical protein TARUN_3391 [Trichoderma arundinaceum]